MSRISKLVAELCPDGVEYLPVQSLVETVRTPRGVKRSDYALGTKYPIVDQGQALIAGYTDDRELLLPAGDYVVFGDHTRAIKWVDFPFAVGADGTKVLAPGQRLVPKFAYYALSNLDIPDRGYNRHWTILRDQVIPVPPLEVQREIVSTLDNFTQLEAELEAELEARRIQYSYFTDALFAFGNEAATPAVEWVKMGDLGHFIRGRRFTKRDYVDSGVPAIHYGEIYTHYGTSAEAVVSHVRNDLAPGLRFAQPGDVIVAGVGETVEDVGKAVAWLGQERVAIHDDCYAFRHDLNPRFVAHYMRTTRYRNDKSKYVARAKVKRLLVEGLSQVEIPVPPLAEQERIASVLDSFEALTNDIAIGIPAEQAARRKQYEYYRDKLLTFNE